MLSHSPTQKRGANDLCAYGAMEIGAMIVNKVASCDWPDTMCSLAGILHEARYT